MHEHAAGASQCSFPRRSQTVTHGPVPIALSAGVHSIKSSVVTVASDVALSSADLALQDTGALSALSAAEYGRLAD